MLKKVVVSILVIFYSLINVNAETIYGQYYKVDELDNVVDDEMKIETYKIYNTYHLEYVNMGYLNDNDKYIKDESKYIEEKLISATCMDTDQNTIKIYTIQKIKNKITFAQVSRFISIKEIEVYYKDRKLDYQIGDTENLDPSISKINDGDFDDYYVHQGPRNIELILDAKYDANDIAVIIYGDLRKNASLEYYLERIVKVNLNAMYDKHIIKLINNIDEAEKKEGCVNIVRKYRYDAVYKVKDNKYVEYGDNLLLDDYKIINNYYKRDKLILSDELVIDDKKKLVDDFIEYSSGQVFKDCDINYDVNGKYTCLFELNDIKVSRDILVDIKSNDEQEYIVDKIDDDKNTVDENKKNPDEKVNEYDDVAINENGTTEMNKIDNKEKEQSVDKTLNKEVNTYDDNEINDNVQNNNEGNNIYLNETTNNVDQNKKINRKYVNNSKRISNTNNESKKGVSVENTTTKSANAMKEANTIKKTSTINTTKKNKYRFFIKIIIIMISLIVEIIFIKRKRKRNNVENI